MAKAEPALEVITFTAVADDASLIFDACASAGFPETGDGVRDLLITLIESGVRSESSTKPSGAASAIAEALSNPAVRDLLADVGKAGLRRMFRGPK